MNWDILEVQVQADQTLFVRFRDGLSGLVQFKKSHFTGVFEPLMDPRFFGQVRLDHGVVGWPGDIELAPDAMHKAIKDHGVWILQ